MIQSFAPLCCFCRFGILAAIPDGNVTY
jgi:hypothetical protein